MSPGPEDEFLLAASAGASLGLVTDKGIDRGLGEDIVVTADMEGRDIHPAIAAGHVALLPELVVGIMARPELKSARTELAHAQPVLHERLPEDPTNVDDIVEVRGSDGDMLTSQIDRAGAC